MFKNALVSVSDKSHLDSFVPFFVKQGMRVVSTGGTAKYLQEAGVDVVSVSEQTGFPEVMGGRVKTLHPKVHMCLLARSFAEEDFETLKQYDLEAFDLVVGNLYPFEDALKKSSSLQEQTEFIDIGGPSFLRAAAKSFERVTVICDPKDYEWIMNKNELTLEDRKQLAAKVFAHTAAYDSMIAKYLGADMSYRDTSLGGRFVSQLRYGENPQQQASWFRESGRAGIHDAEILQGKALSFNNLLDIEAAVSTLREFDLPACISVKHNNPCGVAIDENAQVAVEKSLKADPVSVFGGIVACNRKVDEIMAKHLTGLFLECVVAPEYTPEAMSVLAQKKNLRVLAWPDFQSAGSELCYKSVSGGFLIQEQDKVSTEWQDDWKVFGESPDQKMKDELLFAWKVCAHLKSNAIAVTANGQSLGLGMGQVNRVDAVEQSILRAKNFHPESSSWILASDAFFPFADSIEKSAQAGIKWVIQPGGSIKDEDVIQKAKELGVNMVLTGSRHFMH